MPTIKMNTLVLVAQRMQKVDDTRDTADAFKLPFPVRDAARVVVAPSATVPGGVRLCIGRRTQKKDLVLARTVDDLAGPAGLYDLAKRCEMVWRIEQSGTDDRTSLLLAAVFASTMLGPILTKKALFGVRTARKILEAPPAS